VTFKAAAYSYTASLLGIIPICGGAIGGILGVVFLILGMKQGHKTETWKAVMSVLIWVILLFICCGLIALLGGLAAASLFHSANAS